LKLREVTRHLPIFSKLHYRLTLVLSQSGRDPRFDPFCGTFDETRFRRSYQFLDSARESKASMLQRQARKERDLGARELLLTEAEKLVRRCPGGGEVTVH
jgi:hypothetical protein